MKTLRLLVVAAVIVAALATLRVLPVQQYLASFLDWVDGLGVWGPVILAAAYVPATVLFVPGAALTLGSGFTFGVLLGTVVVSIGSTLGSTAAFLLGRTLVRDWVASKVKSNPRFEAIDRAVETSGFKIVLLTRLSPMFPYNLLGYMYGLTSVRLRDYVLASWIGMLPGTLLYVYLGSAAKNLAAAAAGGAGQRGTVEWVFFGAGLVATLVVTVVVTRIARRAVNAATANAGEVA